VKAVVINSKDLDSSCWFIQAFGKSNCKTCQYNNTRKCGANCGNAKLIKESLMQPKSKKVG